MIIAVVALAAVVVWQWEFLWGELPGAVGAPEETIVVTSRADSADAKLMSIALAVYMTNTKRVLKMKIGKVHY